MQHRLQRLQRLSAPAFICLLLTTGCSASSGEPEGGQDSGPADAATLDVATGDETTQAADAEEGGSE